MEEKNIKLILAYDGTCYNGWQIQNNGVTIQGVIEEKIRIMTGESVNVISSGRTDAGVHAENQVCNFLIKTDIPPESLKKGLNSLLPDDILIKDASHASSDFHSRYSAKCKIYEYRILNREEPDIFLKNYVWHIRRRLYLNKISEGLTLLEGTHDFSSFRSSGSNNKNPLRTVFEASLIGPDNNSLIKIRFKANGFLRHMVRNIVGTIVDLGLNKINVAEFNEIIELKDRRAAGLKAPASGLFLVDVLY